MTEITIRRLQGEEKWDTLHALTTYAFRPSPPLMEMEEWKEKTRDREDDIVWACFVDGEAVACAAERVMDQNIRGKHFPLSGMWGVVTHPAHRRKGYAKKLMVRALTFARQGGRPVSCLYPFRESFYQRLGYATFPHPKKVTLHTQTLAPLLDWDIQGTVEMMGIKEAYPRYWDFLHTYQKTIHGMALAESGHYHRAQLNEYWVVFAAVEGQVQGLMVYKIEGEEITQFTMQVRRFYPLTSDAKYLLLEWIARHIDQVEEVEIWLPADARPETWLADLKLSYKQLYIPPMGRILDVEKISGVEVGSGRFSARVLDDICPWNEGQWTFQGEDGSLSVTPATESDLTLTIQGLTALLYGTHHVGDFPLRGWGDVSPELRESLSRLFPLRTPFLHEFF